MANIGYGSIQLKCITDLGEFSVLPMSNMPASVSYDPNTSTYAPNWGTQPLTLTPLAFYAGKELAYNALGFSVTWKRQDGAGDITDLTAGETVSQNKLTVNQNKLATGTGIITYICTATYKEPKSQKDLVSIGRMTFSLIKQAPNLKLCAITGESAFLYNADQVLQGVGHIMLSAKLDNVSVNRWEYKNASGAWTAYPTTNNPSVAGESLKVTAAEAVFFNDIAVIRITTNDPTVFDMHTIVKLRDGAPGEGTIVAQLDNDDQMIPCNSAGIPIAGAFTDAVTRIMVYEGGTDITSAWTITATPSNGVTGTWNNTAKTYSVTGMSTEVGSVDFVCTKSGCNNLNKKFSLIKQKTGADGISPTIYSLSPSTLTINKSVGGILTPSSVTFSAYSKTGVSDRAAYTGRFKIYEDNVLKYTSASNEAAKAYTPAVTTKAIKCELYTAGATTTLLDTQSVLVTADGATGGIGADGKPGSDATNVIMGNQAEVIPCNTNGTVKAAMTINIPFAGYKGITKVACTATVGGLPTGITVSSNTAATAALDGLVVLAVAAGANLADKGEITLTFALNGTSVSQKFTWTKSIQPAAGSDAVLFQLFAPQGNVISNGANNVQLTASLIKGAAEVTSGVTYTWAKYTGSGYQAISGQTASSLTVTPEMVETYASFRCIAAYGGKDYTAYYAVLDKSDPLDVHVYCSLGTLISNGVGIGAVYVEAVLNGEIVDPFKTKVFSLTAPTSPKAGDYYYKLDPAAKACTLMKYSGSAWAAAPAADLPTGNYIHSFVGNDGNPASYNGSPTASGKVLFVDAALIDEEIGITCKVTL